MEEEPSPLSHTIARVLQGAATTKETCGGPQPLSEQSPQHLKDDTSLPKGSRSRQPDIEHGSLSLPSPPRNRYGGISGSNHA
jgi:hypothetical protein